MADRKAFQMVDHLAALSVDSSEYLMVLKSVVRMVEKTVAY